MYDNLGENHNDVGVNKYFLNRAQKVLTIKDMIDNLNIKVNFLPKNEFFSLKGAFFKLTSFYHYCFGKYCSTLVFNLYFHISYKR